MFKQYMHLEKFGNTEVENIELGVSYIFPKLDGTNASVWATFDQFCLQPVCGSRTRELPPEITNNPNCPPEILKQDNAGFAKWMADQRHIWEFLDKYPTLRLFGEWLVPHSFKGYRPDAWKQFYVFDVFNNKTEQYLSYDAYKPLLDEFNIQYIPPLAIVRNASYEHFLKYLDQNRYLCPDDGDPGEGIVIKNYDFYNRFGRQTWAKIVRQEFKEIHAKAMGAPEVNVGKMNEERIVDTTVTLALVEKTIAKIIESRGGWSSKNIPELLERVFYDIIKEELWDQWKAIGFATINGRTMKALTINRIKQLKPEIFR